MSYLLLFFSLSNYSGCISDNLYGFRWRSSSPSPTPCDIPAVVPVTNPLRHRGETRQISLYILCCCSNRICCCPSGRSCSVYISEWPMFCRSVPANFRRSICPFLAKVMPDFSVNFSMTLLNIGHLGYLRLMHGPGYLSISLSRINYLLCYTYRSVISTHSYY